MADSLELRRRALEIWRAGVEAVDSERLVRSAVVRRADTLVVCGHKFSLADFGKIAVVGAGKAGAGMAAGIERALGADLWDRLTGWVNVPADCVRPLERIHLHPARPAGLNEPTEAGVEGAREILRIVGDLTPRDLCLVLLSGGASALLPLPPEGVSLASKQAVTRLLSERGASIEEMNCVRKHLSQVKGGRLARAIRAGQTIALVISDVVGDPLETIGSGPTVPDATSPADALAVLHGYARDPAGIPQEIVGYLEAAAERDTPTEPFPASVHNHIIGNNATALEAAARRAAALGYRVQSLGSKNRGEAAPVGESLAELALSIRDRGTPLSPPACVLSGGEPVVDLGDNPGKGGRNQEVALAALARLQDAGCDRIAILSGGTDGEDGPTDAAGAIADSAVLRAAQSAGLNPRAFLAAHDAYAFFEQCEGLLKTGPTHTNVMDLRVVLVDNTLGSHSKGTTEA